MFNKLATIMAAAMMTLSASSAFAAFANYDLIRVISDSSSTREIATNLGNINTLSALTNATVGGGADAFTNFIGGSSLSNLSVTYFAVDRSSLLNGTMFIASNSATTPATPGVAQIHNKLATNGGAANTPVLAYYNTLTATGATVIADNLNSQSLAGKFGTTTLGTYGNYAIAFANTTNLSLANLAIAPITMTVYQFGNSTNMATAQTGLDRLDITLNADGSSTINAPTGSPVPVPAAAWLLGSGLMGLVGLRRRKNA